MAQVGYHDGGVEMAFGHFMQVNKDTRVATVEAYLLIKFHGGIAVCVEREHTAVQLTCIGKGTCLAYEPLEEGDHRTVATQDHALGMPLHAYHRLVLGALDGFDESVGGEG